MPIEGTVEHGTRHRRVRRGGNHKHHCRSALSRPWASLVPVLVTIFDPLEHIAMHVVEAEGVGILFTDGMCLNALLELSPGVNLERARPGPLCSTGSFPLLPSPL